MSIATLFSRPDYADAEIVARRLAREELIEHDSYIVTADHEFNLCDYCEFDQAPAVLAWQWSRHDATTDGYDTTCANWACCRAVLSTAELDADPEDIVVESPILAGTMAGWEMAA